MRFRVSKKDLILFGVYCCILLYFCAIAVLNFVSFANEGKFYGLLPFKAFLPQYILYTLGLFVALLILIFSGVSSYIFEKDKSGFFIHVGDKKSDGYEKWASEGDIKKENNVEKVATTAREVSAAGVPLINDGKNVWVDNGEYHNLVIGATGSGKTETIVKPMVNLLSKKGESMVITDPKGEIYEYCGEYLKQQGYNIVILNFRNPSRGNSWNPLTLPYKYYKSGNKDKGIELLDDVALNILYDKASKADPFWERSAADYFSGLSLGLFDDATDEKQVNLNSINLMSTVGEERRGAGTYIKEYFTMKGEGSSAYTFANGTINAPNDTKNSILSTFRQKIRQFATQESLSEMLSYSDFDMRDIGNKKTAVFMIIHDEKKTYHGLMTIFIKQCYETLVACAQEAGGKLPYRTNFILDEFANMPPLNDVDSMVTAARSRAIRFTFIIQNFSQLNDVYGENIAETIKGNCGNLIYLISTELKALEEISKMCGEVKSKDKDKTASTPLVTVTDLQKMKLFEAIIKRWRISPFKTKFTPDFKIDWGTKLGKAELPEREVNQVQLFDVKEFVNNNKKTEQMSAQGRGGFNPFASGFNPFASSEAPSPSSAPANPFASSPMPGPSSRPSHDVNPFASASGMEKPSAAPANPFAPQYPFGPAPAANPFMPTDPVDSSDDEMDEMIRKIEEKLKALAEEEEEEERNKTPLRTVSEPERPTVIKTASPSISNIVSIPSISVLDDDDDDDDDDDEFIEPVQIKTYGDPKIQVPDLTSIENALKSIEEKENKDNDLDMTQEIKVDLMDAPIVNVDNDSVVINENVVSDDQFFDDFFDE